MKEQRSKAPWFAVLSKEDGSCAALTSDGHRASEIIRALHGAENRWRVVECEAPEVQLLKRVKCTACDGAGTVLEAS